MSGFGYGESGMETIELTPGLVFERLSDVGSPPTSLLSYNSTGRSSLGSKRTDTAPSSRSTTPRKQAMSPPAYETGSTGRSRNTSMDGQSKKGSANHDRGYYSLGSAVARSSRLEKEKASNASDYGVAISIKGIKGHPFVILEDKEKHRHMVPAPDPETSSETSLDKNVQNGHLSGPEEPPPKAPPRRGGTLSKDWKTRPKSQELYSRAEPDKARSPVPQRPTTKGPPANERLVKPSDVKAAQKPKSSPSLHMRSPRSRSALGRGDMATRSRSLSPNRALASGKANRSRSVSPPRKVKRRVDDNSVQPVSNLIGFFETNAPDSPPARERSPSKVPLLDKPVQRRDAPEYYASNTFPRRDRIDSKEVDVTPGSKKSNLTVTTATMPSKRGTAPAGRYFALTSPAATTPAPRSMFHSETSPRLAPLKGEDAPSAVSTSSSGTGQSTDEGSLNVISDDARLSNRPRSGARLDGPKPWMGRSSDPKVKRGVLAESVKKPSEMAPSAKAGFRRINYASSTTAPNRSAPPVRNSQCSPSRKGPVGWPTLPAREDPVMPQTAKKTRLTFTSLQEGNARRHVSLFDVVQRMSDARDTLPRKMGDKAPLVSYMSIDSKRHPVQKGTHQITPAFKWRGVVEEKITPTFVKPPISNDYSLSKAPARDTISKTESDAPKRVVSEKKIVGPSHQLLKKTRKKRNAQRLTTSSPRSAASGSEYSESECSDADSLGAALHLSDDEEALVETDASPLISETSPRTITSQSSETSRPGVRSSGIVFGKISSEDVTKKIKVNDLSTNSPHHDYSLSPSVADLQEHISELRATVQDLQRTADDNAESHDLLEELRKKLKAVEAEKSMLDEEIVEGREVIRDLERKLDHAQKEVQSLRQSERRDRIIKQEQAKDLDDLRSELRDLSSEVERSKSDDDLSKEEELTEELDRLQKDYDVLVQEQSERENFLMKREKEINSLKKALHDEAEGHDEEVEVMRRMHDDVMNKLRSELENLRQESAGAVDARPILEDHISSLKEELQKLKERRVDEQRRLSVSSDEGVPSSTVNRVQEELKISKDLLKRTQDELKQAQMTSYELQREVNNLQKKLQSGNKEKYNAGRVEELSKELAETKQEKKNLETKLSSLDAQRSTLKSQVQSARGEREDGEREIRNLENDTSRLKARIQELENEVERLKKELSRSKRHLEAQVCDLERQVNDSERQMSELMTQRANLEKCLAEAKVMTSNPSADWLPNDVHDLERQKSELESALSKQQSVTENLQQKIEALVAELQGMSSDDDVTNETMKQLEEFKRNTAGELETLRADVEAKAKALRDSDRTNQKLQEELRRMDVELEEELKERETTLAEYRQVERNLHELEARIARSNRDKEEQDREIEKLQSMLSLTEDDKLNLEEKLDAAEIDKLELSHHLRELNEDVKDKDLEIEELKYRIKTAESSTSADQESRLSELEHELKMSEMSVSGLKQALEAKHDELEEAELQHSALNQQLKDSEAKSEEATRKLRDVEKKRRLAAKEAEDLTLALSEKVAELDEAQRKLRRVDAQMADLEASASMASNVRVELDKIKRKHRDELSRLSEELEEARSKEASTEQVMTSLEEELRGYEMRYQTVAAEAMELDRQRRNAEQKANEAQKEVDEKGRSLTKLEDKVEKLDHELNQSEETAEELANQLREAERHRKEAELKSRDLQSELSDKEREMKEMERRLRKLHDEMINANHVSEESHLALAELEASKRDASDEVNMLRDELEEVKRRAEDAENKVEKLEDQMSERDASLLLEQERVVAAARRRDALMQEVNNAREELDERTRALQQTHDSICDMEKKLNDFEAQRHQAKDRVDRASHESDDAKERVDVLEEKLVKSKERATRAENLLREAEDEMKHAREKCDGLEAEVDARDGNIKNLEEELERLREEIGVRDPEVLEEKCKELMKQVDLLQLELKERSDWSDRKREELKEEIKSLEEDLKNVEGELEISEKDRSELEDKLAKIEIDGAERQKESDSSLRKELEQLRDSLDARTQQIYSAEDTIYRQKEVIEELTSIQQTTEKSSLDQMDAYMAESEKQFEQLKSSLSEKSEQVKLTLDEKEQLAKEVEELTMELERIASDAGRSQSLHQEDGRKLEELENLLSELRQKLKNEQKDNDELREKVAALETQTSASHDLDTSNLQYELGEVTTRLEDVEQEKKEALKEILLLTDKIGQLDNELEMNKSQVDILQHDAKKHKDEMARLTRELENKRDPEADGESNIVVSLKEKITSLEEKLRQEANELNAIDTHHRRAEMKLREVLKQAESETNKANSEKEMLGIRAKSLKQQVSELENQLESSEVERSRLEEELRQQQDLNFDLRRTIQLRLPQPSTKSAPPSGNLFTSV